MDVQLKQKISLAAKIMEVTDQFWNAQTTMAKIQKKLCFSSEYNQVG